MVTGTLTIARVADRPLLKEMDQMDKTGVDMVVEPNKAVMMLIAMDNMIKERLSTFSLMTCFMTLVDL